MLLESNCGTRGLHQELLQKKWRWTLHIEGGFGEGEGVEALVGEMETMNGCGVLEASLDDCHAQFRVTYFLSWLGSGYSRRSSGCLPHWLSSSPGTNNCMTGEDRGPSQGDRESDSFINSGLYPFRTGGDKNWEPATQMLIWIFYRSWFLPFPILVLFKNTPPGLPAVSSCRVFLEQEAATSGRLLEEAILCLSMSLYLYFKGISNS